MPSEGKGAFRQPTSTRSRKQQQNSADNLPFSCIRYKRIEDDDDDPTRRYCTSYDDNDEHCGI